MGYEDKENVIVNLDNKELKNKIGNLSDLQTTEKSNLDGAINELDAELADTAAKCMVTVSVKHAQFGAKGDDVHDDTQKIIDAINTANAIINVTTIPAVTVFIPKGSYKVTNIISVPRYINIVGEEGTVIKRYHHAVVGYSLFRLSGDNVISNITLDGGSSRIPAVGEDFVSYGDIHILGDNVKIISSKFINSCGSFIVHCNANTRILDCDFGDYRDHAIYTAGNQTDSNVENIQINDNRFFTSTTPTRECVKFRNGVDKVTIDGNIFELPNATFITLDTGDPSGDKANGLFTITSNTGNCSTFIVSFAPTISAGSVLIEGNNVECSSYMFKFGAFPLNSTTQSGTIIEKLMLRENNISSQNGMILNGQLGGNGIAEVIFSDNNLTVVDSVLCHIYGEVTDITFKDNVFDSDASGSSSDYRVLSVGETNLLSYTFKGTKSGVIIFDGNSIRKKFQALLYENSTNKIASLIHWTVYANDNISNETNFKPVNVFGDQRNTVTEKLHTKDNKSVSGTLQDCSWSDNNWIKKDSKQILDFTFETNVTLAANTGNYIEVINTTLTGNERLILKPQDSLIPSGVIFYGYALDGKFRVQFYNTTTESVTVNMNWIVTIIF